MRNRGIDMLGTGNGSMDEKTMDRRRDDLVDG